MVGDKIQVNLIHLMSIDSINQVDDIFTKQLHLGHFTNLVTKLGMMDIHSRLWGDVTV